MHITPVPDIYPKNSAKGSCISYSARRSMLEIMADSIKRNINPVCKDKEYKIEIIINDIEMILSCEKNAFLGTYNYVAEFSLRKNIDSKNIFLLYGLDNAKALVTTGPKRWKNPIHLVSKFKFLVYPRSGFNINHAELAELFSSNIDSFDPATHQDVNLATGEQNLLDIQTEMESFRTDSVQFMKEHFLQVTSTSCTAKEDSVSFAETSSSNIRKVLYSYNEFKLKPEIIDETLRSLDPMILAYIKENNLYNNECEDKTALMKEIPEDWKQ